MSRRRIGAVSSTVLAVVLVGFGHTAVGAAVSAPSDSLVRHCTTLLGAADPKTGLNSIVSETCTTMKQHDRDALLAQQASYSNSQALAGLFDLVTIFDGLNRTGASSTIRINGDPCDSAGYRFTPSPYWKTHISSLGQGAAPCNRARVYNNVDPSTSATTYVIPTNGIGEYNNNVGRMQVYNG